eukprot:8730946-Pyramimonas_sp.AAC.1
MLASGSPVPSGRSLERLRAVVGRLGAFWRPRPSRAVQDRPRSARSRHGPSYGSAISHALAPAF